MTTQPDFSAAAAFSWRTARLLDRFRFSYLFLEGEREPVLQALRAYRNSDGGFGNALEPDLRCPTSQPVPVWSALEVLDQVDGFADPMVRQMCDYMMTITRPDGGVPFVLPSARDYPRAPWCETNDNPTGSLNPTAPLAGLLYKHRIDHPWLTKATEFCWRKIEDVQAEAYEMRAVLAFLEKSRIARARRKLSSAWRPRSSNRIW